MQHYNSDYAQKMLDLNPDWMAIAVEEDGTCMWSTGELKIRSIGDWVPSGYECGYLGKFTYTGHWKDTLVVRKCTHIAFEENYPIGWKYCPKCGELLGSK